jgi:predicted kinase
MTKELQIWQKALMGILKNGKLINWKMTNDRFDRHELNHELAKLGTEYKAKPIYVWPIN